MPRRGIALGLLALALAVPLVLLGLGEEETGAERDGAEELGGVGAAAKPIEAPVLQGTARDAPAPAEEGELVSYHGEVQDEASAPVAGAVVAAVHEGRELVRTTSDAEGRFRFPLRVVDRGRGEWGTVLARTSDGRVATRWLALVQAPVPNRSVEPLGTDRYVGVLVMRAAHALEIRIAGSCGTGREARVRLAESRFGRQSSLFESETIGGALRVDALPAGSYRVAAYAEGCGRTAVDVLLPREATGPLVLELGTSHRLLVRVVEQGTQTPVEGARVGVKEFIRRADFSAHGPLVTHPDAFVTDAAGQVVIEGLAGRENLRLSATAEGYPGPARFGRVDGPATAQVGPGRTEVTLELTPPRTVRWPIEAGAFPVPPEGTVMRLEPWTNTGRTWVPPEGVVEGGYLVIHGWGSGYTSGYAHAPDGSMARFRADKDAAEGTPIVFFAERSIRATLRFEDGAPVVGWNVVALDGGNNDVRPAVKTDADGVASLTGLYGGPHSLVTVQTREPNPASSFVRSLGSVNLGEHDGSFEATILRERSVRVSFRVDGAVRLLEKPYWIRVGARGATIVEEDAAAGAALIRVRPHALERPVTVEVHKRGFRSTPSEVTLGGADEVSEVTVDLARAGSLRVRVTPPADDRYGLVCQRWNPSKEAWERSRADSPAGFQIQGRRADPNGVVDFLNLEPGRYRARDEQSGLASAGVEVSSGDEPADVGLDLSSTGWVRGRVLVPPGQDVRGVGIGIRGGQKRRVGTEGQFWVRVPGTREVVIEVTHPILVPAEGDGTVRVRAPRDDVVFRLEPGRMARLRFDPPLHQFMNRGSPAMLAVRLYRGAVEGEPAHRTNGTLDGNGQDFVFGGYEPGTYTVWIDAKPKAPLVLDGVVLREGTADLGVAAAPEGSTLRVTFRVKEGQSPPSYDVFLMRLDEPKYTRRGGIHGGRELRVTGIGKGRFQALGSGMRSGATWNEEIEFEGEGGSLVERVIDLR